MDVYVSQTILTKHRAIISTQKFKSKIFYQTSGIKSGPLLCQPEILTILLSEQCANAGNYFMIPKQTR